MKRNNLVIGLLWHSVNSHNFGVGALTLANIALIRRVAAARNIDVAFVIIGWRDTREPYVVAPDVTMMPFRPRDHLRRPGRLMSAIRHCDLVFDIGSGDSFSDLYGVKRFVYMAATKVLVLALGRPLILSPQTIGPYRRGWVRAVAARIMKRAAAVVARHRLSYSYLRELGIRRNACESIDIAFDLPANGPAPAKGEKVRIGLNVSGLLFNGGAEVARKIGLVVDYAALTERTITRFLARRNCEVHLIGHVFADDPLEDDRTAIRQLAARFPDVVVAPEFASPTAAKAYIGAMDFFIGARMHACIASYSSGVPVIPMAYSRKFAGLFGSLGYDWVADCTSDSIPAILERISKGFSERTRLRAQVQTGLGAARTRLQVYEAVIARSLESAVSRQLEATPVSQPA